MSSKHIPVLSSLPLFRTLGEPEMQALASRVIEKTYAAGEVLFFEGEACDGMFIVAHGKVKIYKTSSSGREMTIAMESAPSTVAELPMFDGGAYPASVRAVTDVVALFFHKRDFFQLCRLYPDVALKILAVVGRRLRHLVFTLESVTFGSIRQRLARLLLEARDEAGSDTFVLPVTHQELASRLGTVREVVSRNLGRFQTEGLLSTEGRNVEILDRNGLLREADTEL